MVASTSGEVERLRVLALEGDEDSCLKLGEHTVENFNPVKNKSSCPFAKSSKLLGSPLWDHSLSFDTNIAQCAINLRSLASANIDRADSRDTPDGLVLEIPLSEVGSCRSPEDLGRAVGQVVTILSGMDVSTCDAVNKLLDTQDGRVRGNWRFSFAGCGMFITAFSPCYPPSSSRYQFGEATDSCFILFQPDASFIRRGVKPSTLQEVHKSFLQNGQPYREDGNAIVKPLDEFKEAPLKWWSIGGREDDAGAIPIGNELVITCERCGDVIVCSRALSGNEEAQLPIEVEEDPFGQWLMTAFEKKIGFKGAWRIKLIHTDGTPIDQLDKIRLPPLKDVSRFQNEHYVTECFNDAWHGARRDYTHNTAILGRPQFVYNKGLLKNCPAARLFADCPFDSSSCGFAFGFHGTSEEAATAICYDGFDPNKRKIQTYGPGEYLALSPIDAIPYDKGSRTLVFAAIILSKLTAGVVGNASKSIVMDSSSKEPAGFFPSGSDPCAAVSSPSSSDHGAAVGVTDFVFGSNLASASRPWLSKARILPKQSYPQSGQIVFNGPVKQFRVNNPIDGRFSAILPLGIVKFERP